LPAKGQIILRFKVVQEEEKQLFSGCGGHVNVVNAAQRVRIRQDDFRITVPGHACECPAVPFHALPVLEKMLKVCEAVFTYEDQCLSLFK